MKYCCLGRSAITGRKSRCQRGSIIIICIALLFVLVPIGLISYEAVLARAQYQQLKAATDASALAASTYMNNAVDSDEATAEEVALTYFRKNRLITGSLEEAVVSPTALGDSPPKGESRFNLTIEGGSIICESAFGLEPSFLKNLGVYPLHARSICGASNRLTGDVVLVLDLSGSMTYSTRKVPKTAHFSRKYHKKTGFVDYVIDAPPGGPRPAKGWDESAGTIPNPSRINYYPPPDAAPVPAPEPPSAPQPAIDSHTPKMQAAIAAFNNSPDPKPAKPGTSRLVNADDIKAALLIEGKKGYLESKAEYTKQHSDITDLKFVPNFETFLGTGFQLEYQRIALTAEDALHTAKKALHYFIDHKAATDVHWSLVGFGKKAGEEEDLEIGSKGTTLDPAKPGDFRYPIIPLSQTKNAADGGVQAVKDALDFATVSLGTNTPAAIREAITQLEGPGHTQGWDQTMIIFTDGIPTSGGSGALIQDCVDKKNIKVYIIGYFLGGYAIPDGPSWCKQMKKRGAQVFYIPDEADPLQKTKGLRASLMQLGSGEIDDATIAAVEEVVKKFMDKIVSGSPASLR